MKFVLVVAFAMSAAMVFAEQPAVNELQEIPSKYCGTFYLHRVTNFSKDGSFQTENYSPAKPFGKIKANKITLDGGNVLKVTSVKQIVTPHLNNGRPQLMVTFEKADFSWGIQEKEDSKLSIGQIVSNKSLKDTQATTFIVSQKQSP